MKLTFTKELPTTYYREGHGHLRKCRVYKIYDGENPIGQFVYHYNLCFFSFGNQSYHIDMERHYLKKSNYHLINEKIKSKIGEYNLSDGWVHLGLLTIDGQNIFVCDKLPNVRYSIFDPKSWGHFKIQVTNRINAVEYNFRIKTPFFRTTSIKMYPFAGELELWGDNLLLAFAGLFLLEWALILKDTGS